MKKRKAMKVTKRETHLLHRNGVLSKQICAVEEKLNLSEQNVRTVVSHLAEANDRASKALDELAGARQTMEIMGGHTKFYQKESYQWKEKYQSTLFMRIVSFFKGL